MSVTPDSIKPATLEDMEQIVAPFREQFSQESEVAERAMRGFEQFYTKGQVSGRRYNGPLTQKTPDNRRDFKEIEVASYTGESTTYKAQYVNVQPVRVDGTDGDNVPKRDLESPQHTAALLFANVLHKKQRDPTSRFLKNIKKFRTLPTPLISSIGVDLYRGNSDGEYEEKPFATARLHHVELSPEYADPDKTSAENLLEVLPGTSTERQAMLADRAANLAVIKTVANALTWQWPIYGRGLQKATQTGGGDLAATGMA